MPKPKAPLTEKQRRFVRRYLAHGNATQAAREAGYSQPNKVSADLVKQGAVKAAIEAGQQKAEAADVMSREQALQNLTGIAKTAKMAKDRISATALLSKLQGWEAARKHEHSGPGGGPIPHSEVPATREQALEALKAQAKRDPALAEELKKLGG